MPADDLPFDALEQQLRMETLAVSPVTKIVLDSLSLMEFPWPFSKAVDVFKEHLEAGSRARILLMLETFKAELRKHDAEIRRLRDTKTPEECQAYAALLIDLLMDAARKAETTRARQRVKRIGLILANAAAKLEPTDADETEEMMRVAMELSDNDIKFLRELISIEGTLLQTQDHIPRYDAHLKWEQGSWRDPIDSEVDSFFSKLESYGLVARLAPPNNLNIMADFQNRYVLLKKGLRFAALIRETASDGT